MDMFSSISTLKGVGYKKTELFNKIGIFTIYDLLMDFPRDYEDWSQIYTIRNAPLNVNVCVKAYVGSVPRVNNIRKGLTAYKIDATDGESFMDITFFNNKYAAEALKYGEEYIFYGKITTFGSNFKSMTNPRFSSVSSDANSLKPIYSQSADLTSNTIEKTVKTAFESCYYFVECLPDDIRNSYCLMSFYDALNNIHFPKSVDLLEEARRRFIFEELFTLQIGLSRLKLKAKHATSSVMPYDYTGDFISSLPFELTGAQKRAIAECCKDMSSGLPMNRLLQGDVGSGKTAVSAALIYNCIKNGFQAALMAPTEVLATQHYKSFFNFFKNTDIRVELLTGSTPLKNKRIIKEQLSNGEIDLIIGTHAIIQDDVIFKNLGFAVTDEQHRFGVNQRGLLNAKGTNPHVLVMSATPIPRTLSFIIYGDLDLSILDEMPSGRQKTDTFLVDNSIRERAYGYVKKHLLAGKQGYIVCPLVDEDEENPDSDMISSTKLFKDLSEGFFKGFKLGLLYGKMKPADKKSVMESFATGQIDLLISTTVIEVGVDVPNAVIMVIENAEMFGLSQLHQLRGRVGRGSDKSTCILISNDKNEKTAERLKIMTSTTDGFKIADEDLKLRGPGDIFGSRQHGLPSFKMANFITDGEIIRETHLAAEELLKNNPTLEGEVYDNLKKSVNRLFSKRITLS